MRASWRKIAAFLSVAAPVLGGCKRADRQSGSILSLWRWSSHGRVMLILKPGKVLRPVLCAGPPAGGHLAEIRGEWDDASCRPQHLSAIWGSGRVDVFCYLLVTRLIDVRDVLWTFYLLLLFCWGNASVIPPWTGDVKPEPIWFCDQWNWGGDLFF